MGQKEKLIKHLQSKPKDFTFDDASTLLKYFGLFQSVKGHTSGSHVIFTGQGHRDFLIHKPHLQKELKPYQVKELLEYLKKEGLI